MPKPGVHAERVTRGFSLIELLVVLLIFAILIGIAVPTLTANLPERHLAAAGDMFANDINYARAKAQSTGNPVYLAFVTQPDARQVDAGRDASGNALDPGDAANAPPSGGAFTNPPNPGVKRSCREYIIVEARPRFVDVDANGKRSYEAGFSRGLAVQAERFTYLDWLRQYDRWSAGGAAYPVEPVFPYRRTQTAASGVYPDPKLGPINSIAVPLIAYPQFMIGGSGSYRARFRYTDTESVASPVAGDWGAGDVADQQFKVFCVADQNEILGYDRSYDGVSRFYDKDSDNPRLQDQVVDYVLLKRVKLPEDVFFLNPWCSQFVVGYEGAQSNRVYNIKTMQFLQTLWTFKPTGELSVSVWTYDPDPFPGGDLSGLNHGNVQELDNLPAIHTMWMVTGECLDFGADEFYIGYYNLGSGVGLESNKKSNLVADGRMLTLWPLNGKYYVDDYAPNDRARSIGKDDARLDQAAVVFSGSNGSEDIRAYEQGGSAGRSMTGSDVSLSVGAREYGYLQNFLAGPAS